MNNKTKRTTKLFLQQRNEENFKMVVIKENNPSFQASKSEKGCSTRTGGGNTIPPGFKPLASSTPKSYKKPSALTMQKFIGDLPRPLEYRRHQEDDKRKMIVNNKRKELQKNPAHKSWKSSPSNGKLQVSNSSINSIDGILESVFGRNIKCSKKVTDQSQDTIEFFKNLIEGKNPVSNKEPFDEPIFEENFIAISSSHQSSKKITPHKIEETIRPIDLTKVKSVRKNQKSGPPFFPDFDFSFNKTLIKRNSVRVPIARRRRRRSSEFELFLQHLARDCSDKQKAVHDFTLGNFVPFDDFHLNTSEESSDDEETNSFDEKILTQDNILKMLLS